MKQLTQTRRPVLLQPHFAEENDGSLGSQFAKTESVYCPHSLSGYGHVMAT